MIATLVVWNFVRKGGRETLAIMRGSLIDGARQAVAVGVACAIVGVIIGVLTLTGAASSFAGFVLDIGQKSLFLSLLLTMAVCLVLGMGIPTIPNYIITSAIAAPALLKLGVPLIVSHMFVFYFGIMADLTPPVALAAFAAASIAKASPMRIGWKATHIAIAGFVIPYMAVYDPSLMLQGGTLFATAYVVFKAVVAIGLWGGAAVGYLRTPLNWPERIIAAVAAFLLVRCLAIDRRDRLRRLRRVHGLASVSVERQTRRCARLTRPGRPGSAWTPSVFWSPASCVRRCRGLNSPSRGSIPSKRCAGRNVIGPRMTTCCSPRHGSKVRARGMEPPADAVRQGSGWSWHPRRTLPELRLTYSTFAPDYRLCSKAVCRDLGAIVGPMPEGTVVIVRPCA